MIGLSSSKLKQITINKLTKDFEKVLSKYIDFCLHRLAYMDLLNSLKLI